MKAKAEVNDSLLENIKDNLQSEQNERKKQEKLIEELKEVCSKQQLETKRWRSAVIELEKQVFICKRFIEEDFKIN